MSALGQKQTCALRQLMSALPPRADICSALAHVCFGPIVDMLAALTSKAFTLGAAYWPRTVMLIRIGNSDHKLFKSLHPRSHVRHKPHPVGGVRAFENPDCFVRLRECSISRRTERRLTTKTLQAYLSRDRICRHL